MRIVIVGMAGRMGRTILQLAKEQGIEVVAGVEAPGHPFLGKELEGVKVMDDLKQVIDETDVVVDFSRPEATVNSAQICAEARKPLVAGTTGLSEEQLQVLKSASSSVAVLWAPNMSWGVNLINLMLEKFAGFLSDFDVEIVEIHHRGKKDAPSGTAKLFASTLKKVLGRDKLIFGREGFSPKGEEIGVFAVRGGDVVGEHTIYFLGDGERIEIIHRASSRRTFAAGALKAAKWIISQPPGFYSMRDVLGL